MGKKPRKNTYGFDKRTINRLQKRWVLTLASEGTTWDFDTFLKWTRESGYEYGMKLCLLDASKPYSTENACWRDAPLRTKTEYNQERRAKEWDDFMKPIRTALGLNPCDTCPDAEDCDTICEARAKHWDKTMERLRREWGA